MEFSTLSHHFARAFSRFCSEASRDGILPPPEDCCDRFLTAGSCIIEYWRRPNNGGKRAMRYRALGRTGWQVSDISFGAWAIGGSWGMVSDEESLATLHKALECGVNFIDTADVYGDG